MMAKVEMNFHHPGYLTILNGRVRYWSTREGAMSYHQEMGGHLVDLSQVQNGQIVRDGYNNHD